MKILMSRKTLKINPDTWEQGLGGAGRAGAVEYALNLLDSLWQATPIGQASAPCKKVAMLAAPNRVATIREGCGLLGRAHGMPGWHTACPAPVAGPGSLGLVAWPQWRLQLPSAN